MSGNEEGADDAASDIATRSQATVAMEASPLNPYAPSKMATDPGGPADGRARKAARGHRLAGALLVGNAMLLFAQAGSMVAGLQAWSAIFLVARGITGAIELGLGALLLAGSGRVLFLARLGAVLGLLFGIALYFVPRNNGGAVLQVLFAATALVLLLGEPGKHRVRVGLFGAALYGLVQVIGFVGAIVGSDPTASLLWFLAGETELSPVYEVRGSARRYQLTIPNDKWRSLTVTAQRAGNPAASCAGSSGRSFRRGDLSWLRRNDLVPRSCKSWYVGDIERAGARTSANGLRESRRVV